MLLSCSRRGSRLVLSTGRARSGPRGRNAPLCHVVRLGPCRTDETQDLASFYNQGNYPNSILLNHWVSDLVSEDSLSLLTIMRMCDSAAEKQLYYSSGCNGYVVIRLTLNKFRPVCATGIRYWEWDVYVAATRYVPIQSVPSPLNHPYTRSALALGSNSLTFPWYQIRRFIFFHFLLTVLYVLVDP